MSLNEHPTYYDVLDLKPDASPHEIREAYLRTKATYNKDSAALYTLIGPEEREQMLRTIEEAYEILSHPGKRKEYDRYHGLIEVEEDFAQTRAPVHQKIVSIDRVPPMEEMAEGEELLIAPATDFGGSSTRPSHRVTASADFFGSPAPVESPMQSPVGPDPTDVQPMPALSTPVSVQAPTPSPAPFVAPFVERRRDHPVMINPFSESPTPPPTPAPVVKPEPKFQADEIEDFLAREIEAETEWSGLFLRRVREARKISLEEMSGITKVNKGYILAIEEENFAKLPAAVFVRGFVNQLARTLKLPTSQVVNAYLARFNQALTQKVQ